MDRRDLKLSVPVRLVFVDAPADVTFMLRSGKNALIAPTRSSGKLVFELSIDVRGANSDGSPRLLGEFTHRRPYGRILVVNSGTLAGQADSCWTRAALVPLAGITWELIDSVVADNGTLEARLPGKSGDGGPVCATVKFGGWRVTAARASL